MVLGVAAVLASIIVALALPDRTAGSGACRRACRHAERPCRCGSPTPAWWAGCWCGTSSDLRLSDDGYNLTMARVSGDAGYITNYYRYFGATEAPFDWSLSVLAHPASISTAGVWMRLPATAAPRSAPGCC